MPVERIAKSLLGLLIEEHPDIRTLPNAPTDQGHLSGMLDPSEGIICVDRAEADRSPQRKRFTIGHEIGHSRMHVVDASGVFADPRLAHHRAAGYGDDRQVRSTSAAKARPTGSRASC